ncbi:hypothetical protein CEXT_416121 [Caerostris extrusa]|uniref:Uncharacterized protein n=1 Tax=Caerostris extrusa TaxID=172846 RepID=A0AAV4N356_CAEEX|nr:hypothetical protein CEXT_416121 [Caerostris extrusa]
MQPIILWKGGNSRGIGTRADGRSWKVKAASSKNLFINQEPNSSILGHTVKTGQCVILTLSSHAIRMVRVFAANHR